MHEFARDRIATLHSIIGVTIRYMGYLRHQLTMGDEIAPWLAHHGIPGIAVMCAKQALEEPLGCCPVAPRLA